MPGPMKQRLYFAAFFIACATVLAYGVVDSVW